MPIYLNPKLWNWKGWDFWTKGNIPEAYKEKQRGYLLGEGRNPQRFTKEKDMWEHYAKLLAEFKRLFPESVTAELNNFKWEGVRDELQQAGSRHKERLDLAANLKTVRPHEITSAIISQKAKEKFIGDMRAHKRDKKWDEFCNLYADFRILDIRMPDDLTIDQETYKLISEELEKRLKAGFNNKDGTFGSLAGDLRMACADEVLVDDTGIHIMDKNFHQSSAPLPEVKKF